MSLFSLRTAGSDDLPALSHLLPSWELDAATFCDGDSKDRLLLAFSSESQSAALGCIRIRLGIGLTQPRYWFHVGYRVHAAADLGMFRRERTLLLGNDHTGATELCDVAVDSRLHSAQQAFLTQLLVRAALLLLHRDQQAPIALHALPRIICAVPGPRDDQGAVPFWEGLGRHFYADDVELGLARFGAVWFTHVAALLPRHPLVVSVLHAKAQAAIGAIDASAAPLRDALLACGLRAGQHIDLRDGGPVFEAHLDRIARPTMRRLRATIQTQVNPVQQCLVIAEDGERLWHLNARPSEDARLILSPSSAAAAGIAEADLLWADVDN